MTVLWRVSRHRDLRGAGGLKAGGRWHYPGRPIVYLAETPAAAVLEVCVHTAANDLPPALTLLRIEGPDGAWPLVQPESLPAGWRAQLEITRDIGAAWLAKNASVLLRVPSAIVPATMNCLLNPLHPRAAAFRIAETMAYPLDPRLKR